MKKILSVLSLLACASLFAAKFPPRNVAFQNLEEYEAKVAYPQNADRGRVWCKGAPHLPYVTLYADGVPVGARALFPPHYTAVLNAPMGEVTVVFSAAAEPVAEERAQHAILVTTRSGAQLENSLGPYAIVFYGCFQPFTVGNDWRAQLYAGDEGNGVDPAFFRFFGEQVRVPADGTGRLGDVRLVVGTGDQVYVDAGYEHRPPNKQNDPEHPISAWQVGRARPQPLLDLPKYGVHLDQMYREFYSFRALNDLFRRTPQVNAWDDHDIRDGWGSQGDEYDAAGQMQRPMGDFYRLSRVAYLDHQFSGGPRGGETERLRQDNAPMHQTFSVGRIKGFAFDTRSNRNASAEPKVVLDAEQKAAFTHWLQHDVHNGETVLLVSPMPLFLKNNDIVSGLWSRMMPGDADDIHDGWESNPETRNWILQQLLEARIQRCIQPLIVSGDYHKTAASEIWYYGKDGTKKVFGYEVLATGLYHEGLARGKKAKIYKHTESQRVGGHRLEIRVGGEDYTFEPYVKLSRPVANFAALTVVAGVQTARVYVPEQANPDQVIAAEYSMPLDWTKEYNAARETTGSTSLKQKLLGIFSKGNFFNVRPLERTAQYPLDTAAAIRDLSEQ